MTDATEPSEHVDVCMSRRGGACNCVAGIPEHRRPGRRAEDIRLTWDVGRWGEDPLRTAGPHHHPDIRRVPAEVTP